MYMFNVINLAEKVFGPNFQRKKLLYKNVYCNKIIFITKM